MRNAARKAATGALILLSLFVLSYTFLSVATLPAAVLAENFTNETTTTILNVTTTTTTSTTVPTTTTTTAPTTTTTSTSTTTTTFPNITNFTTTTTTVPTTTTLPNQTTTTTTTTTIPNVTTTTTLVPNATTTTTTTTTTTLPPSLKITITIPKTTYYPGESLEPRLTITDQNGKLISDATIKSNMTGPKTYYPYFFYSVLCDCYKAFQWLDESTLPGEYTLLVEASRSGYPKATVSSSFKVVKPTIPTFEVTTDNREYYPGDSVKLTITIKDSLGNVIKDAYITGDIRDAGTGMLVSLVYPSLSGDAYTYSYYLGSETLGKSYKFSISTTWKEQKASGEVTIYVAKRGLNADVVLEKNVLGPKDVLRGKIKVYDKDGNVVKDAKINIQLMGSQGFPSHYLSATFKDGFYEIEPWTIQDWMSVGFYTVEIKISKYPEDIRIEKQIEITKQKLNVEVTLDKTSYKPGDKIYIKVLVTLPDGTIAKDAKISGEVFPIEIESSELFKLTTCRIYSSPIQPVYYKGEFVQKYFIDSPYIPTDCPVGRYVLKLKVYADGYSDAEVLKEFEVALAKLFIETGFSADGQGDSLNLAIYADVKDEDGNPVEFASVEGILRPPEEAVTFKGCLKRFYLYYDNFLKRYISKDYVSRYECPEGNYIIQLKASSPSYESAEVVQSLVVQYKQGYESRTYVSPTPTSSVCREVSCGPDCVQKVCESETPVGGCVNIVMSEECVNACKLSLEKIEKGLVEGGTAKIEEADFKECVEKCKIKVACQGSQVPVVPLEVMIEKLNELRAEVEKTQEEVSGLKQLLLVLIDFVNSILSKYLGQQNAITIPSGVVQNATNTTNPITGAFASLVKSLLPS